MTERVKDTFWVNPSRQALGCYRYGLEAGVHGDLFQQHAERIGIWTEPQRPAGTGTRAAREVDVELGSGSVSWARVGGVGTGGWDRWGGYLVGRHAQGSCP
ncbi:MAG: hypothetical protein OXE75_10320 [bacterium]|nr:hypothetical protein [bacterium]